MIRVGVVNTCIHAYLYGACFAPYDRYQYLLGGGQLDIMESSSVPVIPFKNTTITGVWSGERPNAEQYAQAFHCQVVDKVEDLASLCDVVFNANTGGPGDNHLEIASLFLEKGIPVNLDKPLADSLARARQIVALAKQTGTPVYASSLLQYVKATEELKAQNLGEVRLAVATGGGSVDRIVSAIHTFSTLNGFMGPGIRSAYFLSGKENAKGEVVRFLYQDGRIGMLQMNGVPAEFRLDVFGTRGWAWRDTPVPNYRYGAIGMARAFITMVADPGKEPALPYEHLLEIVAAIEAARLSKQEGREVELAELL
ncbi:MAG: Gfo/Idh/MocA family oxidoreductase [Candidatus Latescibacterota bacterium]